MKLTSSIIIILFSVCISAQQTKKIKHKISSNEKETFYVLASDEKTKHGKYEYFESKQLIREGFYKNGLKDSIWMKYIWNGELRSKGYFKDDLKNGHWVYYGYKESKSMEGDFKDDTRTGLWKLYVKGELAQEFNFDTKKLFEVNEELSASKQVIFGGQYDGLTIVDKPASYKGSEPLTKFIVENFNPVNKDLEGRIIISARLNLDGSLSEFKVDKSLDPEIDNEAIRILKLTVNKWSNAEFLGDKVSTRVSIPIFYQN